MAKCLKEKSYEIISRRVLKEMNSRKIIDDFCGSILADLRQLDSYKRLKEISVMHSLFDPLTDEELKEKKKTEIAEIGILTLTIDSSLSELTNKKLKNFSKEIILDIIKDLKDVDLSEDTSEYNSKINEDLISKNRKNESDIRISIATDKNINAVTNTFESHSRSSGSLTSENLETTKTSKSSSMSNGSQIPVNRSIESNLKSSGKYKNTDTTANTVKSNSRSNKNVISKSRKRKSSLKNSAKHKKTDSNSQNSNNFKTMTGLSEKCETFSKKFMEMNPSFLNRDDDSESDVSIGSMSSVHTSDLSSFDDVISFSSEDESGQKKKKRISINEANTKYFRGQLYDIYEAVSSVKRKALAS